MTCDAEKTYISTGFVDAFGDFIRVNTRQTFLCELITDRSEGIKRPAVQTAKLSVLRKYNVSSFNLRLLRENVLKKFRNMFYCMAELVHGEKEHSDWFPERSIFCYTGPSRTNFIDLCS